MPEVVPVPNVKPTHTIEIDDIISITPIQIECNFLSIDSIQQSRTPIVLNAICYACGCRMEALSSRTGDILEKLLEYSHKFAACLDSDGLGI